MKTVKIALIATVLSTVTLPAFAGSVVTNSYTNRKTTGSVNSTTNLVRNSHGVQNNHSQSLKMETYGGDLNISNVYFDGTSLTGNAHSSNQRIVDPVAIGAFSSQNETVNFSENLTVQSIEQGTFVQKDRSHSVTADTF